MRIVDLFRLGSKPLGLKDLSRRFRASNRGGVALVTALALPPLLVVSLGAIQLQSVLSDKSKAQDIADSAALWGAQQLTVVPVGAEQRTEAFADTQLLQMRKNATVTVKASVASKGLMKVSVDTYRPSFFFNMFPKGGFNTHAESVAEGVAQVPLCVLIFGEDKDSKLDMGNSSQINAPGCLVHSNTDVSVSGTALLQAEIIQAKTGATGPMKPKANTGAPDVDDPFSGVDIQAPTQGLLKLGCTSLGFKTVFIIDWTLAAGNHCSDIEVGENVTLRLAPGEHYFAKGFKLKKGARLTGQDVVLVFGPDGDPDFTDGGAISLEGRRSGRLAGFVVVTTRDRTKDLKIDASAIGKLTGTIYVPNAQLMIQGSEPATGGSDWTVIVAKGVKMSNKPQIVINTKYAGSAVPVPGGVGSKSGQAITRLVQ